MERVETYDASIADKKNRKTQLDNKLNAKKIKSMKDDINRMQQQLEDDKHKFKIENQEISSKLVNFKCSCKL